MKKIFFLLIAANGVLSAFAQTTPDTASKANKFRYAPDSMLSRWVIDLNLMGGGFTQNLTTANSLSNYPSAISNGNLGSLKFSNGASYGGDLQVGYFFGRKAHFGIGTGVSYFYQTGDAKLDQFHVEYLATDQNGNVFRQVVTADNPIKEQLKISNVNIPLLLKYKNRFSKHWGFTADAGILFNLQMSNSYTTNASFDYEAIYKLVGSAGNQSTVYDNAVTPASTDLMITKAQYLATHPGGDAQAYLNAERALGYNVGSGVKPNNNTGSVSYTTGSVGFLVRPAVSYFLSDKVAINLGLYYTYQNFNHNASNSRLTDRVGDYSSVLTSVSSASSQSYGLSLGVRYYFAKLKDRDHDGIPDKRDKCPDIWGLPQFQGCPDTDSDGVPDSQDSCVDVPGLIRFHGCPDTDGDGIPDKYDACPTVAGSPRTHGCPDADNDGVADNEDKCPTVWGPISNNGCPVDTVKPAPPAPANPDRDITEPILFDVGKIHIKETSLPVLTEAVMELNTHDNAFIIIDGHTDNTGNEENNEILSFKRANAVKKYLTEMGANPKRMIAIGHGSRQPIAPNTTAEGRAKNRRVIMSVRHHQ